MSIQQSVGARAYAKPFRQGHKMGRLVPTTMGLSRPIWLLSESRRIVRRPAAHAEHLDSVVDTGSAMAKGAASAGNPNVLVRPYASKIVMPITATIAGCQPRAQKPSSDHFKSEARGKGSKGPRH